MENESIQDNSIVKVKPSLRLLASSRSYLLKSIETLSVDQLNKNHEGFSNNIVWNLGHILYTQFILLTMRTGNVIPQNYRYLEKYKSGTRPEEYISEAEKNDIKFGLIDSI